MAVSLLAVTAALLLILAAAVVSNLLRIVASWRTLRRLPMPAPLHPLLGHAEVFTSDQGHMLMAKWALDLGSVYCLRALWSPIVVITDPGLAGEVLQKGASSATYVPKDRRLYMPLEHVSRPPVTNTVTASDGAYWKAVRAAWARCMTTATMKRLFPSIVSLSLAAADAAVAESAGGSQAANMSRIAERITLDVIGHLSYGQEFGAVRTGSCSRHLDLVTLLLAHIHDRMSAPLTMLLRRLGVGPGEKPAAVKRQEAALLREWDELSGAFVKGAMESPPPEGTLAAQLLQVSDPDRGGAPLTADQLKSELALAILAGFETTSCAITWALAMLSTHPKVLAALEAELDAAGLLASEATPQPRAFEWGDLGRLPYLGATIKEVLRLFPPAANGTARTCDRDVRLSNGLLLPKGTIVGVPFFAIGHNPLIYGPDTEAFIPERWMAQRHKDGGAGGRKEAQQPAGQVGGSDGGAQEAGDGAAGAGAAGVAGGAVGADALPDSWPFSTGPRDCAGQVMARIELQVILATLVGRLKLQLAPEVGGLQGLLGRQMFHTTLQMRGGLPMVALPRAAAAAG